MTSETIEITTADGAVEACLTRPDEGEHPAVLLYPDAIGLRPRIEEMADRIAGWGDVVVAAAAFHPGGLVTDAEDSPHRRVGSVRAEARAAAGASSTSAVYDAVHGYSRSDTAANDEAAAERHFGELEALLSRALGR